MSIRAPQLNRHVADTPLKSDSYVVNVASPMVMTPMIKSGPCSGMRGASTHCVWAKRAPGAQSSGTESVKVKSVAVWVLTGLGAVSRRVQVTESTSKHCR